MTCTVLSGEYSLVRSCNFPFDSEVGCRTLHTVIYKCVRLRLLDNKQFLLPLSPFPPFSSSPLLLLRVLRYNAAAGACRHTHPYTAASHSTCGGCHACPVRSSRRQPICHHPPCLLNGSVKERGLMRQSECILRQADHGTQSVGSET